jgi:hypothetical protein
MCEDATGFFSGKLPFFGDIPVLVHAHKGAASLEMGVQQ